MRVNSNADSLSTLRAIHENYKKMQSSAEKLSSGKKINRASDDPAGLIVSERMRSQIAAAEKELENIDRTSRKLDTADSDLANLQESLREIRNNAVAASNEGANSEEAQRAYQESVDASVRAYNRQQNEASYSGQKLFDGSSESVADVEELSNIDVSTAEKAQEAISAIDEKIKEISNLRGDIGATQKNDLTARRNNLETELVNLSAAESSVRDTDLALEYVNFVKNEMQVKASVAMLAQQKQAPNLVLTFLQQ